MRVLVTGDRGFAYTEFGLTYDVFVHPETAQEG